jgi:predicted lipid-binding transport protein (Tim44 family)
VNDGSGRRQQAVAADRDTQSLARRKRVISLFARAAPDRASRDRDTQSLAIAHRAADELWR